jgi:hypothetical protein
MAKAVATTFTTSDLENYGNIILNGYLSVVPNTVNKKAWQYKETVGAPVNLPSLTEVQPVLKGWTTNYYDYYTELPPNAYNVNPGDPTMFEYDVHSYTFATGPATSLVGLGGGSGYFPGTYTGLPTTGGSGTGATLDLVINASGVVTSATINSGGAGYTAGDGLTVSGIGPGTGFFVTVGPIAATVSAIQLGITGSGYTPGTYTGVTTTSNGNGTGATLDIVVGASGSITSAVLNAAGTSYVPGDSLVPNPATIGAGSGLSITVTSVNTATDAGEPKWSQAPRRFFQNQVSSITPPQYVNNPQVIQYSFMYPVADNPVAPPIGTL